MRLKLGVGWVLVELQLLRSWFDQPKLASSPQSISASHTLGVICNCWPPDKGNLGQGIRNYGGGGYGRGPWIDLYVGVMTTTERLLQSRLAFLAGKETKVVAKRLGQQKWWPSIHLQSILNISSTVSHTHLLLNTQESVLSQKKRRGKTYTSFRLGSWLHALRFLLENSRLQKSVLQLHDD